MFALLKGVFRKSLLNGVFACWCIWCARVHDEHFVLACLVCPVNLAFLNAWCASSNGVLDVLKSKEMFS